jgi:2-oxoglutarate ferredoxin oxidoreductase subunit alpha
LGKLFAGFKRVVVVEMNDQGVYGFGQLATILRARYCEPKIQSVTKTDGLTYRVREILEGVFQRAFSRNGQSANGANGDAATPHAEPTATATSRAEAKVPEARDRAGDNTPNQPGSEAVEAASGTNETRPDAAQAGADLNTSI